MNDVQNLCFKTAFESSPFNVQQKIEYKKFVYHEINKGADLEFVKKFTRPNFQAKKFTL